MNDPAAHLAHQFDDPQQQRDSVELGMWTFLATEVLFFGGLFVAFAVYRRWYPGIFSVGSNELDAWLGGWNTAVLLASSLTVVLAIQAVRDERMQRAQWMLLATIVLGTIFLGVKGYEYAHKFERHLVPGRDFHPQKRLLDELAEEDRSPEKSPRSPTDAEGLEATTPQTGPLQLFFCFYFGMTGLHALHVVIGMVVMAVMIALLLFGQVNTHYDAPLEMAGLYWHFVDIVWIFLYPVLYLLR